MAAGEIAVLRLPNAERDVGDAERPQLLVSGQAARVVALAHGGAVLADATTDPAADPATVALVQGTERLAVAVAGVDRADAPGLLGWHAGTELAYLGWGTALAAGATVRAEGTGVRSNRQRRTAGWVRGAALVAGTAIVTTRFNVAVRVVVVALDDPLDTGAGRGLSLGLDGATRAHRGRRQPGAAAQRRARQPHRADLRRRARRRRARGHGQRRQPGRVAPGGRPRLARQRRRRRRPARRARPGRRGPRRAARAPAARAGWPGATRSGPTPKTRTRRRRR